MSEPLLCKECGKILPPPKKKRKNPREFCDSICRGKQHRRLTRELLKVQLEASKQKVLRKDLNQSMFSRYIDKYPNLLSRIVAEMTRDPKQNFNCMMYGLRAQGFHFPNTFIRHYKAAWEETERMKRGQGSDQTSG
jgi:hypothetical protein